MSLNAQVVSRVPRTQDPRSFHVSVVDGVVAPELPGGTMHLRPCNFPILHGAALMRHVDCFFHSDMQKEHFIYLQAHLCSTICILLVTRLAKLPRFKIILDEQNLQNCGTDSKISAIDIIHRKPFPGKF